MYTTTMVIPDDLALELEPYRGSLDDLLRIGLREVKKEQGLALFKKGTCFPLEGSAPGRHLSARDDRICSSTRLASNA